MKAWVLPRRRGVAEFIFSFHFLSITYLPFAYCLLPIAYCLFNLSLRLSASAVKFLLPKKPRVVHTWEINHLRRRKWEDAGKGGSGDHARSTFSHLKTAFWSPGPLSMAGNPLPAADARNVNGQEHCVNACNCV